MARLSVSVAGGPPQQLQPSALSCEQCGLTFKTPSRLSEHRSIHRGMTTCPVCHYVFTRRTQMKMHLKTRHGVEF